MSDYHVQEIAPDVWQQFLLKCENTLFVQSRTFGELYSLLKETYLILGIFDQEDTLVGGSLVVTTHARRGNFLYLPYGPVIAGGDGVWRGALSALAAFLEDYAKKHSFDFIRVSPFVPDTEFFRSLFRSLGFRVAPMHMLAEYTWVLPLHNTLEDIRQGMKKNHRNLIHRLEKAGVTVVQTTEETALQRLNDMHDVVAQRHKFHRFSREFVDMEFSLFSKRGEAAVFEAYLPSGQIDASAVIIFFGNMACYRHSASLNTDPYLPTSYLIQWCAIQEAKKRGLQWYNFWGVAPENAKKTHPFYGITHFKKGFGGSQKNLLHCHDLPVSKNYWLNWLIESIRRKKRGF